jgi:hypothetical protein
MAFAPSERVDVKTFGTPSHSTRVKSIGGSDEPHRKTRRTVNFSAPRINHIELHS